MREFPFELTLCAHLETAATAGGIVSRQLGASVHGYRVVDVLQVAPGPAFDERVALTPEAIPSAAIESDVGAGRARYWKAAFDCHPERARRAVDRALEVGFFEGERRNGRTYVRQTTRYPDWFGRLRGIENKPDLDRPGELALQLRRDVALGLLDEIVLATSTYVTRAHLNRLPPAVGVWRFDPDTGEREVVRDPDPLQPHRPGIEILAEHPGRTDVRVVTPEEKARQRRQLAERAWGKGWRVPAREFPNCSQVRRGESSGAGPLPYCAWNERVVDPGRECGPACPGQDPGDPPAVDVEGERARRTAWNPDPPDGPRRQAKLDLFRP